MAQYIHLFDTASEFNEAYNGSSYIEPWVSLTEQTQEVHYNKPVLNYVEIGGIKWAKKNLGATAITDYGKYYAWADIQGYTFGQVGIDKSFTEQDYIYGPVNWREKPDYGITKYNTQDGKTTIEPSDDSATQELGEKWRIPTNTEFYSLMNEVYTAWTSDYEGSGVAGVVCTDKSDSSKVLFFPAAGYATYGRVSDNGINGNYWSSDTGSGSMMGFAYYLFFNTSSASFRTRSDNYRYQGQSIRPILDE